MISANSEQTEADVIQLLRDNFGDLPNVRSVLLSKKPTAWGVLVLVSVNDVQSRERIYKAAKQLRSVIHKRDVEIRIVLADDNAIPNASSGWSVVIDRTQP